MYSILCHLVSKEKVPDHKAKGKQHHHKANHLDTPIVCCETTVYLLLQVLCTRGEFTSHTTRATIFLALGVALIFVGLLSLYLSLVDKFVAESLVPTLSGFLSRVVVDVPMVEGGGLTGSEKGLYCHVGFNSSFARSMCLLSTST